MRPNKNDVFTVEVSYYDPQSQAEKKLYFSSDEGFVTAPDDTPPNTHFSSMIQQLSSMKQEMFENGLSFGNVKTGYGAFYMSNVDGALDFLVDCGLDGRSLIVKLGKRGARYTTFNTVLTATMDFPEFSDKQVTLRIRDKQKLLEKPISEEKYKGDNQGPVGIEGTENDIKGNSKPVIFGQVMNIPTIMVNSSRLVYQVSYLPVTITSVMDRGANLTKGPDYASLNDMMSDTGIPAAGAFRCLPQMGVFRLGSPPSGQVTANAETDRKKAGELLLWLAQLAGLPDTEINTAEFDALDQLAPYPIGVYFLAETHIKEVMNAISQSVGAWFSFDVLGVFHCGRIDIPSGGPIIKLDENRIDELERQKKNATIHTVNVTYGRNYTIQNSDIAGSVSDEYKAWLSESTRKAVATDDSVKTIHLLAEEKNFETALVNEADAQAEASRRLQIYSDRRDTFRVGVFFDQLGDSITQLCLGCTVEMAVNRYGLSVGKKFKVIGLEPNLKSSRTDITLWG